MNQSFAIESMFNDDPFFSRERLLQPLHHRALSAMSGLQQDLFSRRSELARSLLTELCDGAFPGELLGNRTRLLSPSSRLVLEAPGRSSQGPSTELAAEAGQDLSVSLDARGFSPEDITVKLEGRSLAVVAMKQAAAEEAQSCSSATSSSASCSTASQKSGFAQRIDLPAHLDLAALTCSLTEDGHLRIHAPAAATAPEPVREEHPAPLRFRTSLDVPITKAQTEEAGAEDTATHTA